jgi:sugar phosphate isomerase/epimerase
VASRIIVGSLAPQNWHRQARALPPEKRFDYVYEKTLGVKRRFGFDPIGIDFGLAYLPTTEQSYLRDLRARFQADGVVPAVGFGGMRLSNDAEIRAESIAELQRNLDKVVELGATLGFFGAQYFGRVQREGRVRFCVDMLRLIAPTAAQLGLRITQENYDYFTSRDLERICREVGQPHVGVHSDTGNWLILGEDPLEATKRVAPFTLHTHVRDYVVENHTYNGVAVGDGLVDFEAVLPVLAATGGDAPLVFSMEVDTDDRDEDEAAERSYSYLAGWLGRNGWSAGAAR